MKREYHTTMKSITGLPHDKLSSKKKTVIIDGLRPDETSFVLGYDVTFHGDTYDRWTGKMIHYIAQEDDTIASIAKKFKVKENEISLLNRKLGNIFSDNVNEGQKLIIPVMNDVPFLKHR